MQTLSTEDYLKAIYHASQSADGTVATTSIANKIGAKPSSVTDMFKKLSEQKLVKYEKYQGVSLTKDGVKQHCELCANTVCKVFGLTLKF